MKPDDPAGRIRPSIAPVAPAAPRLDFPDEFGTVRALDPLVLGPASFERAAPSFGTLWDCGLRDLMQATRERCLTLDDRAIR